MPTMVMPLPFICAKVRCAAMRSVAGVLNTHLRTGSTMVSAPAIEMNGISASSTTGSTDMVVPVLVPPIMAVTLFCVSRRRAKVRAWVVSLASSYMVSSSGRPPTPPAALMRST